MTPRWLLLAVASFAHGVIGGVPPTVDGFRLVWLEPFTGPAGSPVDARNWNIALNVHVNNEVQEYLSSSRNIQLSGGETVQLVPWRAADGSWSSGRIESKTTFTPQPGRRLLIQASLRTGRNVSKQGIWPAFWVLGDSIRHGVDWPACGELDIFEQINGAPTSFATAHCRVCNEPVGRGTRTAVPDDGNFHTWSLLWDRTAADWRAQSITWLRDFQAFHRLSGAEIGDEATWASLAHSPYFVIMNVAVGGSLPVCIFIHPCIFCNHLTRSIGESNSCNARWVWKYVGGSLRCRL
jgi:beta-glucanase (GH16 family)